MDHLAAWPPISPDEAKAAGLSAMQRVVWISRYNPRYCHILVAMEGSPIPRSSAAMPCSISARYTGADNGLGWWDYGHRSGFSSTQVGALGRNGKHVSLPMAHKLAASARQLRSLG
jgi:hypothetical protein